MARIEVEVVIKRPVEAVFAYINDATHATKWNSDVIEAHASEVPMRMGSTLTVVRKQLGRRVKATYEVKEFEPNKRIASRTERPVPNELTFTFEQVNGGTRMRFAAESDLGGLWKLTWPILRGTYTRQMRGNLDALKAILEAQVAAAD
ncbi:MAG TPA: SRPBCC family protein [Candidatus Dormibacteraeota bacterium]|nr:SRPBCC family protein [Candidatus Dormibacteraeota bacterium]